MFKSLFPFPIFTSFQLILPWTSLLLILTQLCGVCCLGVFGATPVESAMPFFVIVKLGSTTICGGTIVAEDSILTAAHCLFDYESRRWFAYEEIEVIKSNFTQLQWRQEQKRYPVESYASHYWFSTCKDFGPYDIAMLKLRTFIDLANPENGVLELCPNPLDYREGLFIGMGLVDTNPPSNLPRVLMGARIYRHFSCVKTFVKHGIYVQADKQICFISHNGRNPQEGDSGGPLIHQGKKGESDCLIGILSYGMVPTAQHSLPEVFTRGDYFRKWIRDASKCVHSSCPTCSCSIM